MTTEWRFKTLDKYPNRIICDDGSLYNKRGKRLNLKPSRDKYLRCRMYKNKQEYYAWVHRMVAYAFVADCFNMDVHHKDRDRRNNYWWNLEVKTEKDHYEEHRMEQRV